MFNRCVLPCKGHLVSFQRLSYASQQLHLHIRSKNRSVFPGSLDFFSLCTFSHPFLATLSEIKLYFYEHQMRISSRLIEADEERRCVCTFTGLRGTVRVIIRERQDE